MSRARYEVCQRPGCNGDGVWDWRKGEHFAFGLDDAEETTRHLNETGPWRLLWEALDGRRWPMGEFARLLDAAEEADKQRRPWLAKFKAFRGSIEVAL